MTTAVLGLVALALVLLNVRLVQWVVYARRDARDEHEASDLVPQLAKAHAIIRQMRDQLKVLEAEAARVRRYLWPY